MERSKEDYTVTIHFDGKMSQDQLNQALASRIFSYNMKNCNEEKTDKTEVAL